MSFPAFFDTCTLYGAHLNDLILWLAEGGAFRPLWSESVLAELEKNLLLNNNNLDGTAKRLATTRHVFPDAIVEGYEELVDGMACEPKDRHVLAAAVRANAEVLVTFNTADFPRRAWLASTSKWFTPMTFCSTSLTSTPVWSPPPSRTSSCSIGAQQCPLKSCCSR